MAAADTTPPRARWRMEHDEAPAMVGEVLARLRGAASRAQLLEQVSARALAAALASGHVVRVRRGWYALPQLPEARKVAERLCGVASHRSAAGLWGLELLVPATSTHVTVRPNAHPSPEPGVAVVWSALSAGDVAARVTSPVRTVLDCAAALPFAQALAIADSALRQRLVTRSDLVAEAAARRGRGAPQVRRVSALADGRAANPFESALRAIVLDQGLTGFVPQLAVPLRHATIHADLWDVGLRMLLEADSYTWHGGRTQLANDCRRYDEAVRGRWAVLRVAWAHVMFEEEWLGELITDVARHQRSGGEVSRLSRPLRCPTSALDASPSDRRDSA